MGQYGYQQIGGSSFDISSVVSTLPAGVSLGDEKVYNGVAYKCVYNPNSAVISKGFYASPVSIGGGPYTVTVSTVSDANHGVGAVVCVHATATTDTYFWGAYKGIVAMAASAGSAIPAGALAMPGLGGKITSAPSLPTEVTKNRQLIYVITAVPSGVVGGTAYINFA